MSVMGMTRLFTQRCSERHSLGWPDDLTYDLRRSRFGTTSDRFALNGAGADSVESQHSLVESWTCATYDRFGSNRDVPRPRPERPVL